MGPARPRLQRIQLEIEPMNSSNRDRLLTWGWGLYAVSFVLPVGNMWGFEAFWACFEQAMDASWDSDWMFMLAASLSNVVMMLSPLLVRCVNRRLLGALLILGGLHNSRFILSDGANVHYLLNLFPAYYVWWLSFFVTGLALWKQPAPGRGN